jgi:hypothetical protein
MTIEDLSERIADLTATVAVHERRWERLRRITVAALQAALEDDEPESPEEGKTN